MNILFKKGLQAIETEERVLCRDLNWTVGMLGKVMADGGSKLNNQMGRGKHAEVAYKAVFGQGYNHRIKDSLSKVCACSTVDERDCNLPMMPSGLNLCSGIWFTRVVVRAIQPSSLLEKHASVLG